MSTLDVPQNCSQSFIDNKDFITKAIEWYLRKHPNSGQDDINKFLSQLDILVEKLKNENKLEHDALLEILGFSSGVIGTIPS